MKNNCKCGVNSEGFDDDINRFMKIYGKFLKIKSKDINNKNEYAKLESQYAELNKTIKAITTKGNHCISSMNKCKNKHKDDIRDINEKLEKMETFSGRIEDHHIRLIDELPEEINNISDDEEEEQIKDSKNKKEDNDDLEFEEIDVKEIMKNDQNNIKIIENLLESAEYKAAKEEEKRKILKVKNELMEMWNHIEVELNKNNEQIDNIAEDVDNSLKEVNQGDKELEKAAKDAIFTRRLGYQTGLAATLGAAGSIVPGIGNAIGIALGGLIGYGLYRYDNHRLNKVMKKRKKVIEERNKKK